MLNPANFPFQDFVFLMNELSLILFQSVGLDAAALTLTAHGGYKIQVLGQLWGTQESTWDCWWGKWILLSSAGMELITM